MFIAFVRPVIWLRRHEAAQLPAAGIALEGIHELDGDVWVVQPALINARRSCRARSSTSSPLWRPRIPLCTWDLVNLVVDNVGRSDQ